MVDLDAHADGRLVVLEDARQSFDRRLLEQRHHAGRAQHVDFARSERPRRVVDPDDQASLASESDRYVHDRSR